MATKRTNPKTGREFWQVRIKRKGYPPLSKNFDKKSEADNWHILMSAKLLNNEEINPQEKTNWTISQVIEWYKENPNPQRKLETRKHYQRLNLVAEEFNKFSVKTLTPQILNRWIQKRLEINAESTVYHYFTALRNALEWHAVQHNYSQGIFGIVKCPSKPGERDRRFSKDETRTLFKSIRKTSRNKKKEMMLSVLFSIETACRIGEMLQLRWAQVNLKDKTIDFLAETTKTKTFRRIPLTKTAYKILKWIEKHHNPKKDKSQRVFEFWALNEHNLSRQFQICCERATIDDIRYHDLRHEGLSRLFEWVNPRTGQTLNDLEVMSISGHKSISMLKKYVHLRPSTILPKFW